jgi:hypothetical protein
MATMERSSTRRFVPDSSARGQQPTRLAWEGSAARFGRTTPGDLATDAGARRETFCAPIAGQVSRILDQGQPAGVAISSRMWQSAVMPTDGVILGGRIGATQAEISLVTNGNVECILVVRSLEDLRGRNEITPLAWPGEQLRAGQHIIACHGNGMVVELVFSLFSSQRIALLSPNRSYVTAGQQVLQVIG